MLDLQKSILLVWASNFKLSAKKQKRPDHPSVLKYFVFPKLKENQYCGGAVPGR